MKTLKDINERIGEIRSLLETDQDVNLGELEKELRELNENKEMIEKRQQLLNEAQLINISEIESRKIEGFNPEKREEKGTDSLEYRKAFMNYVLRGEEIPAELRVDATTLTTDVGSVIPNTILNKIVEKLEATGMILPLITRTSYKGGVTVPTSTVKPVASWVAENEGSDTQKKTTGSVTFAYHKLRCAVAVSLEVDTVTLPIFEQTVINNIVEAMTKALEQAIISGTGTGQPKGILTETPETGQNISVTTLGWDTLTDAEGALPLEYENGAVWCMTKKTWAEFQGILDQNGQPVARVNYGLGGAPERTLLGRPVVLCNYLDSFATAESGGAFAFLFNFKDYILNTNYQLSLKKYEDHNTDRFVHRALMLVDGKVVDKGSLVVLKKA